MRQFLLILCLCLATPMAWALQSSEMFDDPAEEARARDIGRQLRCVKCRNQSIFDSNAAIAQDLRVVVRERMVAGDSDAEILEYVHQRYGDYVLLKPRVTAQTYILWLTPVAMLLISGLGFAAYMRGRQTATVPGLSDDDRAAAQALLRGKDG